MYVRRRVVTLSISVLVLMSSLPQCMTSKVTLSGAGATFPKEVYEAWISAYSHYRAAQVSVGIDYEGVGSTAGKMRILGLTGPRVDYAGSDSPMEPDDLQQNDLIMFPSMAG